MWAKIKTLMLMAGKVMKTSQKPILNQDKTSAFCKNLLIFSDQKENIDFIEVKVQEVLFGRIWFSVDKTKVVPIWKDDERLTASTYTYEAE